VIRATQSNFSFLLFFRAVAGKLSSRFFFSFSPFSLSLSLSLSVITAAFKKIKTEDKLLFFECLRKKKRLRPEESCFVGGTLRTNL
jgi:hypothetical protein